MRGSRLAALTLTLASCALTLSACYAQTPDEQPGQSLPMQTNVGAGFNCGRVSSPLYCYGIPVTVNGVPGGTFWIDTYLTGYNAQTGFIVWYGVADLAEAHVTSNSYVGSSSMPSSITVNFSGDTNDGDGGSYTGTMTLNFTYYYSSGGGGRGGAGAGYRFICTGGTVNVTYR
ncbi:hypothetical protein DYQ86_17415 [Acidobacteria bacterium AB60]|nr:hypothetical protein DYQ86_17415 [Acidobacteria bacterium AB60]